MMHQTNQARVAASACTVTQYLGAEGLCVLLLPGKERGLPQHSIEGPRNPRSHLQARTSLDENSIILQSKRADERERDPFGVNEYADRYAGSWPLHRFNEIADVTQVEYRLMQASPTGMLRASGRLDGLMH